MKDAVLPSATLEITEAISYRSPVRLSLIFSGLMLSHHLARSPLGAPHMPMAT